MHGFLTTMVQRQMRRLALGATLGMAIVTTTAVAAARFHDPRFDEADLAVEKALILLSVAECGTAGEKSTEACQRHQSKTIDLLTKARAGIAAAAAAADGAPIPPGTTSVPGR